MDPMANWSVSPRASAGTPTLRVKWR